MTVFEFPGPGLTAEQWERIDLAEVRSGEGAIPPGLEGAAASHGPATELVPDQPWLS